MDIYSYKIDHDFGLAPNPFFGYCTLAVCKSQIRKNKHLTPSAWVIGTGSKSIGKLHHLVFAMRLEEKITINEYWNDPRFQLKKPILNGSLVQMYGDNIYHQDTENGEWIQENSAHSLEGGKPNEDHKKSDVRGKYVLISKHFYYFGDNAPKIPDELIEICCEGRDMKWRAIPHRVKINFIAWLESNFSTGIHGDPISWNEHIK